jgi:hypothetical protein
LLRAGSEFLVIVLSILAAFALDAWWDSRVEDQMVHETLHALEAELITTRQQITLEREKLESARNAVVELLVHVSPHAPLLDPDSLEVLMDLSFRVGTIELQVGSLQAILSTGILASIRNPGLARLLATWPNTLASVRTKSSMLEENREIILGYLHDRFPTLEIARKTGQMSRYPASGFEASAAAVQGDRRVEGLFGNRGMLIEDTDERLRRLDALTVDILALIHASPAG